VDNLEDDGAAYGAEEVELQSALEKELTELEEQQKGEGEDQEMAGVEREDEVSDAGSEDLEAESSGSEEEDLDEEEVGEEDEDVEMGEDDDQKGDSAAQPANPGQQHQPEVMVH
jgi:histone chaperone ASF1